MLRFCIIIIFDIKTLNGDGSMKKAFSLTELMIVVAVIGILAALSVPYYFSYLAKAKQAEVSLNLASLHTAMQAYYAEHGSYSSVLMGEGGIGWQPAGYHGGGETENFLYTYGFNVPGAIEGVHYFTGKLGASKNELRETEVTAQTFIAGAAGDIVGKGECDVWTVNEIRSIKNIASAIK
jgi:prepilin-type N-terminal cleavage/methylation domain-containing protein